MDFAGIFDGETTGVLVESGLPPLPPGVSVPPPGKIENTVIRDNAFLDNQIGIFTLGVDAGTTTIAHNFFSPGTTPISIN
jgi:hypothetical protein